MRLMHLNLCLCERSEVTQTILLVYVPFEAFTSSTQDTRGYKYPGNASRRRSFDIGHWRSQLPSYLTLVFRKRSWEVTNTCSHNSCLPVLRRRSWEVTSTCVEAMKGEFMLDRRGYYSLIVLHFMVGGRCFFKYLSSSSPFFSSFIRVFVAFLVFFLHCCLRISHYWIFFSFTIEGI